MSLESPIVYSIANDTGDGDICHQKLLTEINSSGLSITATSINTAGDSLLLQFAGNLPNNEKTILDTVVSNHSSLDKYKMAKYKAIDDKTSALIAAGFTFAGKTFSLSETAQLKLSGVNQVRDNPNVTYPIKWNTIDDTDTYEITSSAAMLGFYLTAVGTYRAHVDSGTALKDQVRIATNRAEIDAVIDPR